MKLVLNSKFLSTALYLAISSGQETLDKYPQHYPATPEPSLTLLGWLKESPQHYPATPLDFKITFIEDKKLITKNASFCRVCIKILLMLTPIF